MLKKLLPLAVILAVSACGFYSDSPTPCTKKKCETMKTQDEPCPLCAKSERASKAKQTKAKH